MGIQNMVKAFLSSSMPQFDGETITIGGSNIIAVISETESANSLGTGPKKTERSITAQFSRADYGATIKSGAVVTARGETWRVSSDPGAIRRGAAAVTLVLIEPERRQDF